MQFEEFGKTHHFKNDLAYIEDILIFNILAYNIQEETTEEEILLYFSSFGKVKSVRLVADERKPCILFPKVCFIHYTDATSAASVLKHITPHKLKSEPISVIACNSWLQPFFSTPDASELNAGGESMQESKLFKLTMLNDDCLEQIFKKLGLKDQVRFAMTCQRLKNIFEMVCKSEYKNLRLENLNPLTLWEIREFFLIFGCHIEAIFCVSPSNDRDCIFEFIGKFCPNIKRINLNSTNIESSRFFKVLGKLQNCTVLELRKCYLKDHAINALNKLPNLHSLAVADNYELTGEYMNRLTTVSELVLFGCRNIQPSHFAGVIKSLKDLKSLDIRLCGRLDTFSLRIMLDHSHKLESLKISCSIESYECIARLPSLKKLELLAFAKTTALRHQLFEELVKHKANQLESLRIAVKNCVSIKQAHQIALLTNLKELICGNNEYLTDECLQKFTNLKNLEKIVLKNCESITNEGLLQLVQSCTNLKKVNFEFCTSITDSFVWKVIQVLKSTQNQRGKEACLFNVAESGISRDLIKNDEYIAANGLLKLSFHASDTLELEGLEYLDDNSDDDSDYDYYTDFSSDTDYDEYVDYYDYDD